MQSKPYLTLILPKEQLDVIINLVVAGGKSKETGLDGIMAAATAAQWLQQAIARANGPQAEPELPFKSNGHAELPAATD
jgi:hypothetical protein